MIGREPGWTPENYLLIRWARKQTREHDLSRGAAHLLLILATYADGAEDCKCWPSVRALTEDLGLRNSQIHKLLDELQNEKGLIWRKGRGPGNSAQTELLMPSDWEEVTDLRSTGGQEKPSAPPEVSADLRSTGGKTSAPPEGEVPEKNQIEEPEDALRFSGGHQSLSRAGGNGDHRRPRRIGDPLAAMRAVGLDPVPDEDSER